jgi:DNA-binding NarL/FixJ family response regulator
MDNTAITPGKILDRGCTAMSDQPPIRILLVAEESLIRAGLRKLLEGWPECLVVDETGSREGALNTLAHVEIDLVLLSLPKRPQSLDIVSELAHVSENARVLVLEGDHYPSIAQQIVQLGGRGVVGINKAPDELRRAIQKVHWDEEIWLDRATLCKLVIGAPRRTEKEQVNLNVLTDREREIVELVCKGLTNKPVGEQLFISQTTVRHHLTTIFDKLQIRNRFELFDFMYRNGHFSSAKKRASGF